MALPEAARPARLASDWRVPGVAGGAPSPSRSTQTIIAARADDASKRLYPEVDVLCLPSRAAAADRVQAARRLSQPASGSSSTGRGGRRPSDARSRFAGRGRVPADEADLAVRSPRPRGSVAEPNNASSERSSTLAPRRLYSLDVCWRLPRAALIYYDQRPPPRFLPGEPAVARALGDRRRWRRAAPPVRRPARRVSSRLSVAPALTAWPQVFASSFRTRRKRDRRRCAREEEPLDNLSVPQPLSHEAQDLGLLFRIDPGRIRCSSKGAYRPEYVRAPSPCRGVERGVRAPGPAPRGRSP